MKKFPFQIWLLPFLMGTYFYSCRDGSRVDTSVNLDLRYGVCAAVFALIVLVIVTAIPWDKFD